MKQKLSAVFFHRPLFLRVSRVCYQVIRVESEYLYLLVIAGTVRALDY